MGKSPTTSRGESQSPKLSTKSSPPRPDGSSETKQETLKPDSTNNAESVKPLAPPPRPDQQQNGNTPDFFSAGLSGSLSLEPNPFEQSFGGAPPETPGGTKLPSVAALTSPSSLLPGGGTTPFNWGGGSLRTGPLSPAMLSGPANDYFGDAHTLRGGFPTPNESSLRTGLTPGGSGSMFPAPSPNSQALFAQLQAGGATPNTIDFQRTAANLVAAKAAAAKREPKSQPQQTATSQPPDIPNGVNGAGTVKADAKAPAGPFDPHDNDAANGLFLLAQGRNGAQAQNQYAVAPQQQVHAHPVSMPLQPPNSSPQMNGAGSIGSGSARGASESGSAVSEESEPARPNTRAKGKRNTGSEAPVTNGRRKASDLPAKAPASKKSKANSGAAMNGSMPDMDDSDDDDDMKGVNDDHPKQKMTDEEKRKNFLERNRVAALKCRQRKKQWLANLQNKVELFSNENDALTAQITQLREEVVNLKTLLLAHKDCPVTQQQGLHGAFLQQQAMDTFNSQMNPYGMAAPLPGQPIVAGQVGQRRFS